jgi:Alginate export
MFDTALPADECPACLDGCAQAKWPWANTPPPYSWPPLGWMFRRPTGPGYYSLRDWLTGNYRQKPPPYPWPPFGLDIVPMYDANFLYLEDPNNTEHDWIFDHTKRLHIGDNWMFSIGGEERVRYENFPDYQLSGKDDTQTLERQRVYGDLWYGDLFRIYVEYIDAQAIDPALPPINDIRRNDLLNAFADIKLWEFADNPLYFRIGRQELIYGSERLVSSFDWANVLRSFQGVKTWYRSPNWDVDAFYVQPVIPNTEHGLSSVDDKQGFAGLWATYRPEGYQQSPNQTVDLYVLNLENANKVTQTFLAEPGGRGGYNVTTLGARYFGEYQGLLWDFENMYQCGDFTKEGISADSFSLGLGWHFANLPTNPSFWVYDEFASGTKNPGHGEDNTFNQLFPFSHYYYGWLDIVARENINDFNMDYRCYPCNWITFLAQFHVFNLDSAKDALYNAAGTVLRRSPTGDAGTDVGDEIDLCLNFHLSVHSDILVGYSKLFAGTFIKDTGPGGSPELTYLQYSFRW